MSYLLDTCAISDFFKKLPATVDRFRSVSPKQIHISSVTVMEIEYGLALYSEREKKIRPLWNALLENITVIEFCNRCAQMSAFLRARLKNSGEPVGPYDILIAGTALASSLIIVTSNVKEFIRMPELTVEDWRV